MSARHLMIQTLAAGTLLLAATTMALDLSKGYPSDAAAMDSNKDGMISKEEFMRFHADMFEKMQNADGQVAVDDMHKYLRGPGGEAR